VENVSYIYECNHWQLIELPMISYRWMSDATVLCASNGAPLPLPLVYDCWLS